MNCLHCRICGNSKNNRQFYVREMMFGFRDIFQYFQCSKCECLQIAEFPENISKYYPSIYHAGIPNQRQLKHACTIKTFLKIKRDEAALLRGQAIGKILLNIFPMQRERLLELNNTLDFGLLKRRNICFNSKILDVGSSHGSFLRRLQSIGFRRLLGIDPFIEKEITYNNGISIKKKLIYDMAEDFDLIMFHHSFEHMPDPFDTLCSVSKILSKKGICLLRIPLVSSYAWEKYGTNWVQLDAPRHFFLHSAKSMRVLLEKAGLKLQAITYDSTDFQFWGSEQYLRNIPLRSDNSYWVKKESSIFTISQIEEFRKEAIELNDKQMGDQAAFYIGR